MTRALLVILLLSASAGSAAAKATAWRGEYCIATQTSACAASGFATGNCYDMVFTPPNVGANGPSTEFHYTTNSFAENYHLATGSLIGTTAKTVNGTGIWRTGVNSFTATMNFTKQTPALPTTTTAFINIEGNINNFDGTPGCNVSFRAGTTLVPPAGL